MSNQAINKYYNILERAKRDSKSPNEETVKNYFWMLPSTMVFYYVTAVEETGIAFTRQTSTCTAVGW